MVEYEVKGHVAILTLNRPEARNAVNGELAQAMEACLDRVESDPDVWVAVPISRRSIPVKPVNSPRRRVASAASPPIRAPSR
jgi:hypothetical protein